MPSNEFVSTSIDAPDQRVLLALPFFISEPAMHEEAADAVAVEPEDPPKSPEEFFPAPVLLFVEAAVSQDGAPAEDADGAAGRASFEFPTPFRTENFPRAARNVRAASCA